MIFGSTVQKRLGQEDISGEQRPQPPKYGATVVPTLPVSGAGDMRTNLFSLR